MNYEPVFGFEPIARVGDRRALAIPRRPLRSDARGWVGADGLPRGAPPIVLSLESFEYDRVYGAFWDTMIERDGKAAVKRSAERYLRAIGQ